MENPVAPGADAPAPAAPAAPAPAAPAAPAPAAPAAPAAQPTDPVAPSQPNTPVAQLTPQEQADKDNDDEWDAATKQIFPGLKKPGAKNEPTKPEEKPKEGEAPQDPNAPKKPDAEPGASDDTAKKGDGTPEGGDKSQDEQKPDTAAADARATARAVAQQRQTMIGDVRAKMFADVPTTLRDADGDPINGPEDVMKLIDPRTGEQFTEEAAYSWFLQANQQFKEQLQQVEQAIASVADVNLQVKDEADAVNAKYGEWLKAHPEVRDALWAEFSSSLKKDPGSGIIIEMPFSLQKYYERALAPLINNEAAAQQKAAEAQQAQADKEAADKAEAEKKRQQSRADRSDIYQPPADPKGKDPEEDEWDTAHKAAFPGYQPKK